MSRRRMRLVTVIALVSFGVLTTVILVVAATIAALWSLLF